MNARVLAVRAPMLLGLAVVLTLLLARSSLTRMLPFAVGGIVLAWILVALALLLIPALLTRDTPLLAAALVVVPVLATSAYGASRLDWLRVLKDFGVAEDTAIDAARIALGAAALLLLWALHAVDLAARMRTRAVERGIDAAQADAASTRIMLRCAQSGAIALVGAGGLLIVGLVGLQLGSLLPTGRAAFVVPLLAAALLVGAAIHLARSEPAR